VLTRIFKISRNELSAYQKPQTNEKGVLKGLLSKKQGRQRPLFFFKNDSKIVFKILQGEAISFPLNININ
jgi:hypothetical protein